METAVARKNVTFRVDSEELAFMGAMSARYGCTEAAFVRYCVRLLLDIKRHAPVPWPEKELSGIVKDDVRSTMRGFGIEVEDG